MVHVVARPGWQHIGACGATASVAPLFLAWVVVAAVIAAAVVIAVVVMIAAAA